MFRIVSLALGLLFSSVVIAGQESLDDILALDSELKSSVLYPQTEIEYVLTVESRADVHFSRVNPPKGEGLSVRRGGQNHEYYFIDDDEFRISEYLFFLSTHELGEIEVDGASLTHVAVNEEGQRRRVRNRAEATVIQSKPKPDDYQGRWLPSSGVSLEQYWDTEASAFQVGDSIVRTIVLSIDGADIDSFPELTVNYPDSINVYSEQPRFEAYDGGTKVTLRQVIVPREEGELDIPGISIPWFDTKSSQAQVASIGGFNLNILASQIDTLALDDADTGFNIWKVIAASAMLAWLFTLIALIFTRSRLKGAQATQESRSTQDPSLKRALEQNDHHQIVKAWTNETAEVKRDYRELMDVYLACFYSSSPKDSEQARRDVLHALSRRRGSAETQSTLAPIEP